MLCIRRLFSIGTPGRLNGVLEESVDNSCRKFWPPTQVVRHLSCFQAVVETGVQSRFGARTLRLLRRVVGSMLVCWRRLVLRYLPLGRGLLHDGCFTSGLALLSAAGPWCGFRHLDGILGLDLRQTDDLALMVGLSTLRLLLLASDIWIGIVFIDWTA